MSRMDFWYEFASPYSYLAAMRIEKLAELAGVEVRWRPFLLGAIFAAKGLRTSPFVADPVKGAYMDRDLQRQCARHGLGILMPDPFPQNSLTATRVAIAGMGEDWLPAFSRAVYVAEFAEGRQIADKAVLRDLLDGLHLETDAIFDKAFSIPVKDRLKAETAIAQELGLFGAPSFITPDGELFWGNDRLEDALTWTVERS